jgi:hypothetical protein
MGTKFVFGISLVYVCRKSQHLANNQVKVSGSTL